MLDIWPVTLVIFFKNGTVLFFKIKVNWRYSYSKDGHYGKKWWLLKWNRSENIAQIFHCCSAKFNQWRIEGYCYLAAKHRTSIRLGLKWWDSLLTQYCRKKVVSMFPLPCTLVAMVPLQLKEVLLPNLKTIAPHVAVDEYDYTRFGMKTLNTDRILKHWKKNSAEREWIPKQMISQWMNLKDEWKTISCL